MRDKTTNILTGVFCAALAASAMVTWQRPNTQQKPERSKPQQPSGLRVLAKVTAYCPCRLCCGQSSDGKTSTGRDAWRTRGVAVDPRKIPYGSRIIIPGVGTFVADDTGGAMRRYKEIQIDLRFHSHKEALQWGVKYLEVIIYGS